MPLGYLPEIVNALYEPAKDTGKALFKTLSKSVAQQATGLSIAEIMKGVDGAIQNGVAIAEGTGNIVGTVAIRGPVAVLSKVVSTLSKVVTQIVPIVIEKLMEFLNLFFSQIGGAGTAGGTTGAAGGAFAGAKALAWSSLNTILNALDFVSAHPFTRPVVNVASLLYALKTSPVIQKAFQKISCFFSKMIRMVFKIAMGAPSTISNFILQYSASEYLPLNLKENDYWEEAKVYISAADDGVKIKIEENPRLALQENADKTIVYSEFKNDRIGKTFKFVPNKAIVPLVYVVAETKDKWFFYDYTYTKNSQHFFEVYSCPKFINGKAVLNEAYEEFEDCKFELNGYKYGGVPKKYYYAARAVQTLFIGLFVETAYGSTFLTTLVAQMLTTIGLFSTLREARKFLMSFYTWIAEISVDYFYKYTTIDAKGNTLSFFEKSKNFVGGVGKEIAFWLLNMTSKNQKLTEKATNFIVFIYNFLVCPFATILYMISRKIYKMSDYKNIIVEALKR